MFKENKNLDFYKIDLKLKYKTLTIASHALGVHPASMYNLFKGTTFTLKVHKAIAQDLNIVWNPTYINVLKDVYEEKELLKYKWRELIVNPTNEGI